MAEDEDGVRELLRKVLQEFGYTVLTARHGRDALMLAGEHGGAIDLLLTDVVMPEMSGRELAETLQDRLPDLKVLFMSGYTDDEVLRRGVSGADAPLCGNRSPPRSSCAGYARSSTARLPSGPGDGRSGGSPRWLRR